MSAAATGFGCRRKARQDSRLSWTACDGIDGQAVARLDPREVAEHPPSELGGSGRLILDVDEDAGVLPAPPQLHQQVYFVAFACDDVGVELFLEELDRRRVHLLRQFGRA